MTPRNQDPHELRRRRIEAGLSQTALAQQAGISKQHMSMVERGAAGASPDLMRRYAEILGCTIADLMPPKAKAAAS